MNRPIKSLHDLYAQKRELRSLIWEQEEKLKNRISPENAFSNVVSLLKASSEKYGEPEKVVERNILLKLSAFAMPLAINTMVLKKSGILFNSLMLLLSVKAANKTDTESISVIGEKIRHLFSKKEKDTGFKAYRKPGDDWMKY